MDKTTPTGNAKSGEAGHHGHDRQPATDAVKRTAGGSPDEGEAATPAEVQSRSDEASAMKQPQHSRPDMVHPGPEREEGEKGKGDAHHDQRVREKGMKSEEL